MQRLSLALHTTYVDLLDKLLDEQVETIAREPGAFVPKTVKGRVYWYHQRRDAGGEDARFRQVYLGPETPELLDRIEAQRAVASAEKARRDAVRALTRSGAVPPVPATVGRVLDALARSGLFRLRAVLVGTVAFRAYGPMLGLRMAGSSILTEDIDVAQFRSISIAVEDETPPVLETLRAVDPAFQPVTLAFHGSAPIAYRAGDLRVEFLTPMQGPVEDAPAELPALRTASQPLRFLDFLIYKEVPAVILHGAGVLVNVPDPARYAWHKCLISQRRVVNRSKARKDLAQAEALFEVLAVDRPGDVKDYWEELAMPGRVRWQEMAMAGLQGIAAPVREQVLRLIT